MDFGSGKTIIKVQWNVCLFGEFIIIVYYILYIIISGVPCIQPCIYDIPRHITVESIDFTDFTDDSRLYLHNSCFPDRQNESGRGGCHTGLPRL